MGGTAIEGPRTALARAVFIRDKSGHGLLDRCLRGAKPHPRVREQCAQEGIRFAWVDRLGDALEDLPPPEHDARRRPPRG
jgi:hypothetical protein